MEIPSYMYTSNTPLIMQNNLYVNILIVYTIQGNII